MSMELWFVVYLMRMGNTSTWDYFCFRGWGGVEVGFELIIQDWYRKRQTLAKGYMC